MPNPPLNPPQEGTIDAPPLGAVPKAEGVNRDFKYQESPNSSRPIQLAEMIDNQSQQRQPTRLIGLTGGIATGKSTVAQYLQRHYQLPILDADLFARDAVAKGSPILTAIAERYGAQILGADGSLNRAQLGEIIFTNPQEKEWLEQQIHPFVRTAFQRQMATMTAPTIVLVIPLLFEAQLTDWVTEIWVVTCQLEQQCQRLQQRNQLSPAQAIARIESQWPMDKKVALADVIIDNSHDLEHLTAQIERAMGTENALKPVN